MAKHKRQHGYRSEVKKRTRELFMTPNEATGKHLYTNTQIAKKLREEFNLPENIEPVNILAIGYAAGEPASPDRHNETRKPLEHIVRYESF